MPRNTLVIDKFGLGMACNVGSEGLNEDAAYYCSDVNLMNLTGKLTGVFAGTDKTSALGAVGTAQGHAWLQKTDGKWTLFYYNANATQVYMIEDFYGTPGAITSVGGGSGTQTYEDMVVRHSTVRLSLPTATGPATPHWHGYTTNTYFNQSAVTTPVSVDQECKVYNDNAGSSQGFFRISGVTESGATAPNAEFAADMTYFYRYALEYDGYQLSPLSTLYSGSYSDLTSAYPQMNMNIQAIGPATTGVPATDFVAFTNKRITAVVLFRAESDTASSPTLPSTQYRYVDRFEMTDARWTVVGNNYAIAYSDLRVSGDSTATYNAYAGCSQESTTNTMPWSIGCEVDNYMFIGDCEHADFEESPYMIFRSVAGRFDMYNWQSATPEFIKMPVIPKAIVGFLGRLLVWDEFNFYRINPSSLTIEEHIPGYGCAHQQSRVVTKYGVFFADKNGVYQYDGNQLQRISDPVAYWGETIVTTSTIADSAYKARFASTNTTTNPIKIAFDPVTEQVLVACQDNTSATFIYAYCIPTKGWTVLTTDSGINYTYKFSFINGKNNETYFAGRSGTTDLLYQMFSSSTRKAFTWVSKRISMNKGDGTQKQKVYKIKAVYDTFAGSIKYGKDSTTMNTSLTSQAVASGDRANNYIHFVVAGASNDIINTISVIYRTLVGYR